MIAAGTTRADLGEADKVYARLLWTSGVPAPAIERLLCVDPRVVTVTACRERWSRHTPRRPDAVIGVNVPVLVRCEECGAKYGEALHRPRRPCPHCGRDRLVLL